MRNVRQLDLVSLVIESQIPLFLTDLDNSRKRLWESSQNQPTPDVPIEDIFSLFRRTKTLLEMYSVFCPKCVVQLICYELLLTRVRGYLQIDPA